MRCAFKINVIETFEITSLYRWWTRDESSRTEHTEMVWKSDRSHILRKFDSETVTLQAGWLLQSKTDSKPPNTMEHILIILNSKLWRLLQIYQSPRRLIKRVKRTTVKDVINMNAYELENAQSIIENAQSYKLGKYFLNQLHRFSA
jgi:hypothetical protein